MASFVHLWFVDMAVMCRSLSVSILKVLPCSCDSICYINLWKSGWSLNWQIIIRVIQKSITILPQHLKNLLNVILSRDGTSCHESRVLLLLIRLVTGINDSLFSLMEASSWRSRHSIFCQWFVLDVWW